MKGPQPGVPRRDGGRDRFLESGEPGAASVRDPILASWRRSRFWGVPIDLHELPYQPDIDIDGRLLRAARPVLERLQTVLVDMPISVVVADARATVLYRWVGAASLTRKLDEVWLAPGFNYSEHAVGTNGIGTALEEKRAARVFGNEHFSDHLQNLSCAGVPIRNSLTGRTEGVIDLTCSRSAATPLMSALVQQAAAEIERSMFDQASERERAVLQEFLVANRRANGAVVTVSDDLIILNKPAAQLLDPEDHPLVRQAVVNLMASKRQTTTQVALVRGQAMQLRCRPVMTPSGLAGAIVELKLSGRENQPGVPVLGRSPSPLPDLVGRSPVWLRACERVAALGQDRSWVLITGEAGVGKCAVAAASHRRRSPTGRLAVVELADAAVADLRATTRLEQVLGLAADPSATVVLRHAEHLTEGELLVLADLRDELRRTAAPTAWVVATSASPNVDHLLELFPASLSVPPLRHHLEDIRDLVPALIERYSPRQSPILTSEALQALLSAPWPGNIAQLEGVVRLVLSRQRAGYIRPEDLPPECHTTSHRALTHWETLERDAIVQTLLDTGGDRVEAAQRLGISRATIYRKVNAYGITLPTGR